MRGLTGLAVEPVPCGGPENRSVHEVDLSHLDVLNVPVVPHVLDGLAKDDIPGAEVPCLLRHAHSLHLRSGSLSRVTVSLVSRFIMTRY